MPRTDATGQGSAANEDAPEGRVFVDRFGVGQRAGRRLSSEVLVADRQQATADAFILLSRRS